MTMTDTGVKPIPAYVPPEDGKPRNAVDEKWMKLTRSARHYMERRAKAHATSRRRRERFCTDKATSRIG